MNRGQKNRFAIAIGIIAFSLITQGRITVLAWLFSIPLLPLQRKIRIILLLVVGAIYIFLVSSFMMDMVYDSRTKPLEKVAEEMGWEFDEEPPVYYYEFFHRNKNIPRPAFASDGLYNTCFYKTNRLSGSYLSVPTINYDCKEYSSRNSPNGGSYMMARTPEHFSSVTFNISNEYLITDFAIVHDTMEDLTRIEPYRNPEDKYTINISSDPPRFVKYQIDDEFSYIRQIWDRGYGTNTEKPKLIIPEIILDRVIDKNEWWYIESTGSQIHLHKRNANGGIIIKPKDIPQFIEEAYEIYQIVLNNPPTEL